MKPAQIKELQNQLSGIASDSADVREHFARDGGILHLSPRAVIYPATVADVRTVVAYAAAQATKAGKPIGLTARGLGGGTGGGALSEDVVVAFPAHFNQVIRLSKNSVTVQPGITIGALQQVLRSHGRRIDGMRSSESCTVGGVIAGGALGAAVKGLRVVLNNGSEIETKAIGKRELSRKRGLMTREGDVYRGLDGLLKDHQAMLAEAKGPQYDTAGYRLRAVTEGGSFDLSQLMVGSEGTLGLITEATLQTVPLTDRTTLVVGCFDDLEKAAEALIKLESLRPAQLELASGSLVEYLRQNEPHRLEALAPSPSTQLVVWAEFDTASHLRQNLLGRRAERIMRKHAASHTSTSDTTEQNQLWAPRRAASAALWTHSGTKPLPVAEGISVPPHQLVEFLAALDKTLIKHKTEAFLWGSFGESGLHVQALLDTSKPKGRKTAITLMDDIYGLIMKHEGTIAASGGLGRLKAPYLEKQIGREMLQLHKEVKQICDPQGIFNPGVKLDTAKKELKAWIQHAYGRPHQYDYLPQL